MNWRAASLRVTSATVHLALAWQASGVLSCWVPCSCTTVTIPHHATMYMMLEQTDISLGSAVAADGQQCRQTRDATCTQIQVANKC